MQSGVRKRAIDLRARNSDAYVTLEFRDLPLPAVQSRLRGRTALVPELDIKSYECRAVIDWLDLVFSTDRATQWMWVQSEIEKALGQRCHVRGRRAGDTNEYRDFRVRFQEPDLSLLRRASKSVEDRWGLRKAPKLENLEISIDFRPKRPSNEALGLMFGALVKTHLPGRNVIASPRDRPRFAWGEGDDKTHYTLQYNEKRPERADELLTAAEGDEQVALDATYYTGKKGSASAWRIMTKVIDRQNRRTGMRVELPENERRVRIEVTLNREELEAIGLTALEDLSSFRFQTLQGRYFQFWLPTFEEGSEPDDPKAAIRRALEEERVNKFLQAGVLGLQAMDEARDRIAADRRKDIKRALGRPLARKSRQGKGKSSTLVAFNELSLPVKHALRRLGARVGSRA